MFKYFKEDIHITHLVPGNEDKAIVERVSKRFNGKVVAGKDLMRF